MDGLPGLRVGGTFGPDDPAGLRAGDGRQADGEGKQRFGVHSQAVLFPVPKMAKKTEGANRLTHFAYSNTQKFVCPCKILSNFAKNEGVLSLILNNFINTPSKPTLKL
jgi:hypothetical protein